MLSIPSNVALVAAQFCHTDVFKGELTFVHFAKRPCSIRAGSTNGHYAFRCIVPTSESFFMEEDELLLPSTAFKKKAAYSKKIVHNDNEARFYGGKKDQMELIEARPCLVSNATFPRQFDSLFPTEWENNPRRAIVFNSEYMRTVSDVIAKYSEHGRMKMNFGDSCNAAVTITSEMDDGLKMEFLLLPVMVRQDSEEG
jgi:hypothetical protein